MTAFPDFCPFALWDPSPNAFSDRSGVSVQGIDCHVEAGSEAATDAWFANPGSQVSASFSIAKDGTIRQHVKLSQAAWANGVVESGNTMPAWLAAYAATGADVNNPTVNIEHEGQPGDVMPEAQYQATIKLQAWLCQTFGIPVDGDHIFGHYR